MADETLKGTAELLKLRDEIKALNPGDRLRLAAGLFDKGKFSLAESIASGVVDLLRLSRLTGRK